VKASRPCKQDAGYTLIRINCFAPATETLTSLPRYHSQKQNHKHRPFIPDHPLVHAVTQGSYLYPLGCKSALPVSDYYIWLYRMDDLVPSITPGFPFFRATLTALQRVRAIADNTPITSTAPPRTADWVR
jgi:hypothetical protein